jgi:hypothetical protein
MGSSLSVAVAVPLDRGRGWLCLFSVYQPHVSGGLAPAAFAVSAFFLIAAFAVPLGIARARNADDEEKEDCYRECRELDKALCSIEEPTIRGLAQANFRQMRTFTVIAQQQARMSFYASLGAAAISLFVLLSGTALAEGLAATTAKITVGTLTAADTALSTFLAATFQKSYMTSSRQMSYYYGQPRRKSLSSR